MAPVALRTWRNTILCADNSGEVQGRDWIGPWDLFTLDHYHADDGSVRTALKTWNAKNVSAKWDGGLSIASECGDWQKFTILEVEDGEVSGEMKAPRAGGAGGAREVKVALKTAFGTYVSYRMSGRFEQAPTLGPWEVFTMLVDPVQTFKG
ncbi:hypothetical protein HYH03_018317 [Edaphochlamys debaryana]|uniref:Uncharacterized protein n=1 Tax=Edaphochlamys debaryana TaxID=47281 RepID=A0A835XEV5_9CHLO|nr:hypothetical protein HYH03_018317 [Edaphochlamys debaryana]|eukprot:KAG2482778.1 hypothetical protein HYH03_018317 [Edaphochlamys debaryana]